MKSSSADPVRSSAPGAHGHEAARHSTPPRGILGLPDRLPYQVTRTQPSDELRWCIDRFWTSAWQIPPGRAVTARVLPHPTVNLTLESGELVITGVARGVFNRTLTGNDRVFGIKLRPGVARLLIDIEVGALSGQGQPAEAVMGLAAELAEQLRGCRRDRERIAVTEALFGSRLAGPSAELSLVQEAVAALTSDPDVRRVRDVTGQLGVSERTLQRLFADYLGLTPGWVLRRGRLHAAAERLIQLAASATSERTALADVAAEFGYADQAHLTNDFTKIIGLPPASWLSTLISEHPAG
ncbi:AraC family transcriptional regulator [Microlunatus elymi]|uniref:AraC family transcriptional regulator n=1 Tax=Microlunatus elymi TaxID=2596828 RepID=A0A516PWP5_9ACTN|nr:helix-turn-helix domain-containing protein [Microlunatus elymi]QDP95603.1 AraC family transcriptional regulator [Microlunatus elymi]